MRSWLGCLAACPTNKQSLSAGEATIIGITRVTIRLIGAINLLSKSLCCKGTLQDTGTALLNSQRLKR